MQCLTDLIPHLLFPPTRSSIGLTPSGGPIRTQQQQQQGETAGAEDCGVNPGPLSFLKDASPSRLLYSLMIVEHLLDRDVSAAGGGGGGGSLEQHAAAAAAAAAAAEGDIVITSARLAAMASNNGNGVCVGGDEPKAKTHAAPGVTGGGGGGGNGDEDWEVYQPAAYGADVEDFVSGCGGVVLDGDGGGGGGGGRRTCWRDRFVGNGGIDTLVELLLMRDWDATREGRDGEGEGEGGGEGESTAGISLACLALLLGLVERFMEDKYLPEPRQLGRLVREALWSGFERQLRLFRPFFLSLSLRSTGNLASSLLLVGVVFCLWLKRCVVLDEVSVATLHYHAKWPTTLLHRMGLWGSYLCR